MHLQENACRIINDRSERYSGNRTTTPGLAGAAARMIRPAGLTYWTPTMKSSLHCADGFGRIMLQPPSSWFKPVEKPR
jgi:hypothetical protein